MKRFLARTLSLMLLLSLPSPVWAHAAAKTPRSPFASTLKDITCVEGDSISWAMTYRKGVAVKTQVWLCDGVEILRDLAELKIENIPLASDGKKYALRAETEDAAFSTPEVVLRVRPRKPNAAVLEAGVGQEQQATLSPHTPGTAIYYTLNGKEPNEKNGTLYDGNPLTLLPKQTLKAAAFQNGLFSETLTLPYVLPGKLLGEEGIFPVTGTIIRETVNVRQKPDTASEKLGEMRLGEPVVVLGFEGNYARVTFDIGEAYVPMNFISVRFSGALIGQTVHRVNIWSSLEEDKELIAARRAGLELNVVGREGEYWVIHIKDQDGFGWGEYLKIKKSDPKEQN